MNRYSTISTEYLADKIIGGKWDYRDLAILIIGASTAMYCLDRTSFLVGFLATGSIVLITAYLLKTKKKGDHLEFYLFKRIKKKIKHNKRVIHVSESENIDIEVDTDGTIATL